MNKEGNTILEIVTALRKIGTQLCLKRADEIEQQANPLITLHLRNLDLTTSHISSIMTCLSHADKEGPTLTTLSLSYNPQIGDEGITRLMKNMPISITELGLVNCGITTSEAFRFLTGCEKQQILEWYA